MAIIGDALRQAFMPKREYESLRDEEKAWGRLQRPLLTFSVVVLWIAVLVSASVSLTVVFPSYAGNLLLCRSTDRRVQELLANAAHDSDPFRGSFYLTENQLANYYWMVVFVPSAIVFFASVVYLLAGEGFFFFGWGGVGGNHLLRLHFNTQSRIHTLFELKISKRRRSHKNSRGNYVLSFCLVRERKKACIFGLQKEQLPQILLANYIFSATGISVAYAAPSRHGCLRVVENNYCASKRGGVRCLSILNTIFAIIFALLAMFLGSSLLTLRNSCSSALFWCYEITAWGLVILYGGTAFFLRRKAAVVLDEVDYSGRNLGVEMLEASQELSPDMERRVNEGFRSWMGSSLLSSDEEDDYPEAMWVSVGFPQVEHGPLVSEYRKNKFLWQRKTARWALRRRSDGHYRDQKDLVPSAEGTKAFGKKPHALFPEENLMFKSCRKIYHTQKKLDMWVFFLFAAMENGLREDFH
ncbi:hypothetical protein ACLOJK_020270 [Asimina triloba]